MVPLYQSTKAEGGLLLPKGLLKSASLFPEPLYSHAFPQFSFWLLAPIQKHCLQHLPSGLLSHSYCSPVAKVKSHLPNSWSIRWNICRLLR